MTKEYQYESLENNPGISKNKSSGRYQTKKKIRGKTFQKTFYSLRAAQRWRNTFNGQNAVATKPVTSKLNYVWEEMQSKHFPLFAQSTQEIWTKRFELWKELGNLPTERGTPSKGQRLGGKECPFF